MPEIWSKAVNTCIANIYANISIKLFVYMLQKCNEMYFVVLQICNYFFGGFIPSFLNFL